MTQKQSARRVAAWVLVRVFRDDAFAAPTLSSALERFDLAPKDRALCTEICYGVLRTENHLSRLISSLGKVRAGDHSLRAHLLVSAYQIEFLDRVPKSAAVSEAVEALKEEKNPHVAGFANALLRRLASREDSARTPLSEAILASSPAWLRKRLLRDVGEAGSRALLAPTQRPGNDLRLRVGHREPDWFAEFAEPCPGVPGAYRYRGGGDPRRRVGYEEGAFVVQELGAQLLAHALGARSGERILDACAGRGQKALLLSEQVGSDGEIVATDLHQSKVDELAVQLSRGPARVATQAFDFMNAPPEVWQGRFDRVLVDAPCTGVGTVVRRPEILRRLRPEDPARLSEIQFRLVCSAAQALRPGGTLLFATCSLLSAEGEEVSARVLQATRLLPAAFETQVDGALFPGTGSVSSSFRLGQASHGTDGYFAARFFMPST